VIVFELNESLRRALGARCSQLTKLLRQVEDLGVESPTLGELEAAVANLAEETGAELLKPPPGQARALVAQIMVLTYEMRPSALKGYGSLSEEATNYLDRETERLIELAQRLADDADRSPPMGGEE